MKIRNLLMGVAVATLAALTACEEEKPLLGISIDPTELSFDEAGGTALVRVSVKGDGEWNVTVPADAKDWLSVTGNGSTATVKVLENTGTARTAVVKFAALYYSEYVTVFQVGAEADHDGKTLETAFTASEARAWVLANLASGAGTTECYYVKGVIHKVATSQGVEQYFSNNSFGNATFYIADNLSNTGSDFEAFRVNYLGNRAFATGDTDIVIGDEVVLYAQLTNYNGTPETVSSANGTAFLYSLNGKTEGGDTGGGETGEAKGTGTLEDPYNPAGAAAYAQSLGADVQSPSSVYIKGKISEVKTSFAASGTYGNANFNIVDSESGTGSFYIFQTYYLGNRQWVTGDTDVQVGDEVIVYGPVVNYKGNTPETAGKGASYIYSLNGQTEGGNPAPAFGVASTQVSVGASATSATIKVTGNVAWSASGRGVDVSPASGEGAGDITVSFDPNTDTENAKTYTVVVSTTAEVATQSYTVTITQAKASSGGGSAVTISIDFTDVSGRPDGFPTASSAAATSGTWTLSGYSFSFSASNAYYWPSNSYGAYLLLGKQDSYMLTPAIEGKSLTSVKFLTGSSASENVIVDICTASGTSLGVNSEKLKKGTTYTWTVSGAPAGEGCQIKVTNAYNAQFQNLELVYE